MKNFSFKGSGIVIILFLFISVNSNSQVRYSSIKDKSTMTIRGTSSIHDWDMKVTDLECSATLLFQEKGINSIRDTWFSCRTKSIISDYNLMNNKTYEALKADEFSSIIFKMTDKGDISLPGDEFTGDITGYLSIAGKVKKIDIPFRGKLMVNGQVELEGQVLLKMSEFNIEPPTALMGTLKTGDEVWIIYSLKLERDTGDRTASSINIGGNNSGYSNDQ